MHKRSPYRGMDASARAAAVAAFRDINRSILDGTRPLAGTVRIHDDDDEMRPDPAEDLLSILRDIARGSDPFLPD